MKPFFQRFSLSLLTACLLGAGAQSIAQSLEPTDLAQADIAQAAAPLQQLAAPAGSTFTFRQLGARFPFNLRGVDSSDSVFFNVRADEVVTGARTTLHYSYSPSLLADFSHINILVNDEVVHTIPVTEADAGRQQTAQVELPTRLIAASNQLRIQLIGHYTLECEDPLHSTLWANVSNQSTLNLNVEKIALTDDLSILPLPFFDARDVNRLELPIVFLGNAQAGALEAGGMIASWLGALADQRGARFHARQGSLPEHGHGIVLALRDDLQGLLEVPDADGASITMLANPQDPNGKLLVISARNGEQLRQAAQTLVTGGSILSGAHAQVRQGPQLQPRVPYDAPRWLNSTRPVKFGEFMAAQRLDVRGYDSPAIRMNLRLPPDLFTWQAAPVDVDLKYRYSAQPGSVNSSMLIGVGDHFLKSIPLYGLAQLQARNSPFADAAPGELLPMQQSVQVPLYQLMNRSELNFRYMYDYIKQGECKDVLLDNVRGQIDPESTIDISGRSHYLEMPDLEAFGDAGFPFTRMADLSETAVVLSDAPDENELSAYLTTMGRMGESTGYPATGVVVLKAGESQKVGDKDVLLIGAADSIRRAWGEYLPEYGAAEKKQFGTSDLVYRTSDWVSPNPRDRIQDQQSEVQYSSEGRSGLISGFESPLHAGRSVVALTGTDSDALKDVTDALLGIHPDQERIKGSVVIVRGEKINALLAEKTYAVGSLDLWTRIQWTLANGWETAGKWRSAWIAGLFGLILLAFLISRLLARRKAARQTT